MSDTNLFKAYYNDSVWNVSKSQWEMFQLFLIIWLVPSI